MKKKLTFQLISLCLLFERKVTPGSERSLLKPLRLLYSYTSLFSLSSMHISNTNLYFFFFFFCSDECQMPEHFWMVKQLGCLKLIGVLLSWDSFRSYAISINCFQLNRLYMLKCHGLVFIFAVSKNVLEAFHSSFIYQVSSNLDFFFSFNSWFESGTWIILPVHLKTRQMYVLRVDVSGTWASIKMKFFLWGKL